MAEKKRATPRQKVQGHTHSVTVTPWIYPLAALLMSGLVLLFDAALCGASATGCYVLTLSLLLTLTAREKIWYQRYTKLQDTVSEHINNTHMDTSWLAEELLCMVPAVFDANDCLDYRLGREQLRNAGIWDGPRYDRYDEDCDYWRDDQSPGDPTQPAS